MKIITGKKLKPFNILLHGVPGIGKSTFAENLPEPVFVGAEENDELEAPRLEKPTSLKGFLEQLEFIFSSKDHSFKTLVVDTIDSIEAIIHKEILESDPKKPGAMARALGGYGAAFQKALGDMTKVKELLERIRDERGMNVCLICHTTSKRTADPVAMSEYDEYKLTLHDKVENLFVDWVSAVLFLNYIVEKSDSDRFAFGDGRRVILTEKRPGHLAKNRYNLPYQMNLVKGSPAKEFLEHYTKFYESSKAQTITRDRAESLAQGVKDPELKDKIIKAIAQAKSQEALNQIYKKIGDIVNA